jgi:phospholipid-translocating ATPase
MGSVEKKRMSGNRESHASTLDTDPELAKQDADGEIEEEKETNGRTVYFNIPLPAEAVDENGHPVTNYARNKIRTARYTPLSFVPKNLWFQFHNIANVYFLFIVILGVSAPFQLMGNTIGDLCESSDFTQALYSAACNQCALEVGLRNRARGTDSRREADIVI